jgi:hypothetical protein
MENLEELIKPLSKIQQRYLLSRCLGIRTTEFLFAEKRSPSQVVNWRHTNKQFREIEKEVLANAEAYAESANVIYFSMLKKQSIQFLRSIIDSATGWFSKAEAEQPKIGEKRFVLEAMKMLFQLEKQGKLPAKADYETWLKNVRQEVNLKTE